MTVHYETPDDRTEEDDWMLMEHIEERHVQRAEDGEAGPYSDCSHCVAAFPSYFAEMREAKREYDAFKRQGLRWTDGQWVEAE